jgi:hypothetical protein
VLIAAVLWGLVMFQVGMAPRTAEGVPPFIFPGAQLAPGSSWDVVFDAARSDPSIRKALFEIVSGADETLKSDPSLFRRPTTYEQIPPAQVDSLARSAGPNRDSRALAMNDCRQADFLRSKAVGLAVAARYSSNADYLAKVLEILNEASQWEPFQRPGWSLGDASRRMPVGGDGVNMATAWGVHGVIDILVVLGDRVPEALRDRLRARLRSEVAAIVDSWVARRPWYVQSDAVMSNQWVDPSAALIRACLFLRDPKLSDAYELGVRNVSRTLEISAADGAFLEGVTYAQMSFAPLFQAILAMQDAGDMRFARHPFVCSAWNWFLHQMMPCGALVNCSDSHMSQLPDWAERVPLDGLSMAALASGTREALQAVRALFPEVPGTLPGMRLAVAMPGPCSFPDGVLPWGFFPSQQLATWRESFRPPTDQAPAMGIWIKGGSTSCRSHGHRDQGHVSVYRGCDALLLESGTPDYSDPDYAQRYASAAGHGIMQVDPVEPHGEAVDAPIRVDRMDSAGGRVRVELTRAFRSTRSYQRHVEWGRSSVRISDSVVFSRPVDTGSEVVRFHLGTAGPVAPTKQGDRWLVSFDGASVSILANAEVSVSAEKWPDCVRSPYGHQVLIVRSTATLQAAEIVTELVMRSQPGTN